VTPPARGAYLDALRRVLASVPAGPVSEDHEDAVVSALERAWAELDGGGQTSMVADKLGGRMEELKWQPPILSFGIERHGGTVMGSTRAELHGWDVDVEAGTATVGGGRFRQLRPNAPAFKAEPIAAELAAAMAAGQPHPALEWKGESRARVLYNKIPPLADGPKQTLEGRRRRFREALARAITPYGWGPAGSVFYERLPTNSTTT
jgi:hypothetical protein